MATSQQAIEQDPTVGRRWRRWPSGLLNRDRVIHGGLIAWALIGFGVLGWALAGIIGRLSLVVIPLVVALFPAALLAPASELLKRRGVRPAAAAGIVLSLFVVAVVSLVSMLGWLIANELTGVADAIEAGYADIQDWWVDRFDVELPSISELLDQAQTWVVGGSEDMSTNGAITSAASTTIEILASVLLGLLALFFYLKDGRRIANWFIRLFPPRLRDDVDEVAGRVWGTLGAYFRGQLVVAAVDALFIGLGLVVLGVPLAVPLAVLVFIGGLFPVVGAFTAGAAAVLIALADQGLVIALVVLGLNVLVQQLEGDLLAPLIIGRATNLHPLAVLVALTAGGLLFGIIGAFLAVPVVASFNAGLGYLVRKDMARPPADVPTEDGAPPGGRPPDAGEGIDPRPVTSQDDPPPGMEGVEPAPDPAGTAAPPDPDGARGSERRGEP